MNTVDVKLVRLIDGRHALRYPNTPMFYNLEGYYFVPREPGGHMIKLSPEQIDTLVPKE
jgi:hypothetical protein